ncbi:Beta-barrel assembly machine subunit BamE [Litoreibacter ponti]|uniref:Beta-barrel assembly machine subunit BamE n=1 Tax=Litoreibacter ponti TaxID=1510457 RepID=A0A2T6BH53_9RHOB|nr:outer membrane protein assembly factor BamE [Litoreibacter ponti]PTX55395.1 Beta-barrel assembly machine subunit BamE [Litoreibacter ponti]
MRHGENKRSRRTATLTAVAFAVALSACSPIVRNHGYIPLQEDLDTLAVGADTRGSVEDLIGKPSASGVLAGGDWFYVGSTVEHVGWRAPRETNRQVVALRFEDDVLTNVERYGLEDGQVVELSRRVTETNVRDVTFIRQILRNFGNIDLGEALGG